MKRAALYARVSTDKQAQQQTIESQVIELKKQIARAGQVLVDESAVRIIHTGISGYLVGRIGTDHETAFVTSRAALAGSLLILKWHNVIPTTRAGNFSVWRDHFDVGVVAGL